MFGKYDILIFLVFVLIFSSAVSAQKTKSNQFLVVLGTAQDAGFPQIGSTDEFREVGENYKARQKVVSLGLIDKNAKQKFLFEATPDLPAQLFALDEFLPSKQTLPDGVFLTHAHIGHYTGLMYFGRESVGAKDNSRLCDAANERVFDGKRAVESACRIKKYRNKTNKRRQINSAK